MILNTSKDMDKVIVSSAEALVQKYIKSHISNKFDGAMPLFMLIGRNYTVKLFKLLRSWLRRSRTQKLRRSEPTNYAAPQRKFID
jgi:hypothetical protein